MPMQYPMNQQMNNQVPYHPNQIPKSHAYNNINVFNNPSNLTYTNNVSNQHDVNSCAYCEEIYKYIIFNNLPLKLMACVYCKKETNPSSLNFYVNKFKQELECRNKKFNENYEYYNKEFSIDNASNLGSELKSPIEETFNNDLKINKKKSKDDFDVLPKDRLKNVFCTSNIMINILPLIQKNDRMKSVDNLRENITLDDSKNFFLDTTNSCRTLAEIFKLRRAKLLEKIEKRVSSVNNASPNAIFESENREMKNILRYLNKKKNARNNKELSYINENIKSKNISKNEKSPTIMNRLLKGQKLQVYI
jgi:hypothetical protein